MKILIFEGNTLEKCQEMIDTKGTPYFERFTKILKSFDAKIETFIEFPTKKDYKFFTKDYLVKFDGVIWTGSGLNAYDKIPEVTQQIEQAKIVFDSKIPFYGSCWGLQIATVAAGGIVAPCKNGIELGIAEDIELTQEGQNHFLPQGRKKFSAFCVHTSEVHQLAPHSKVLAKNSHSQFQALEIQYQGGFFWGVQYHPEFTLKDILNIYQRNMEEYKKLGFPDHLEEMKKILQEKIKKEKAHFDAAIHQTEILNFLQFITTKIQSKV